MLRHYPFCSVMEKVCLHILMLILRSFLFTRFLKQLIIYSHEKIVVPLEVFTSMNKYICSSETRKSLKNLFLVASYFLQLICTFVML